MLLSPILINIAFFEYPNEFWSNIPGCFDGFIVSIAEEETKSDSTKAILGPDATHYDFRNLNPCKNYKISVQPFLGTVESSGAMKPIFVGKKSTLNLTTNPDLTIPFMIHSKKYQSGKTYLIISILTNEWPCLATNEDHPLDIRVDLCEAKNDLKW